MDRFHTLSVLLLGVILALLDVAQATEGGIVPRAQVVPAPLTIPPAQNWEGIDGSWNTFTIRVGTPPQTLRALVSFASYQTWVVLQSTNSCPDGTDSCWDGRGRTFKINGSSTWNEQGIYDLYIEQNLGYVGNALYGFDTVGFGGIGEGGPTLDGQVVGAFQVTDFWYGLLGVNPKPTNFTDFNNGSASYMTSLKNQNMIPSISFGFTAGARYRFRSVLSSLTLGGYDASRFVPNNVTFIFGPDNDRDIYPAIQSISTTGAGNTRTTLLPSPVYAYMDSTVAELWLPLEACTLFESAFNLTYDNATDLYFVNDDTHNSLLSTNPNITITLGPLLAGGESVSIDLPYQAFDQTASPPYRGLQNKTRYFPLRRALNDTQYTLGRTFLQEAYLTVDWERRNFSVSQCLWQDGISPHIVAIQSVNSTNGNSAGTGSDGTSSSTFSTGAIAGVVVGVVVLLVAAAVAVFFCLRRRRRRAAATKDGESPPSTRSSQVDPLQVFPKAEMDADQTYHGTQLDDDHLKVDDGITSPGTPGTAGLTSPMSEAPEDCIYEMEGTTPMPSEADGRQFTEKQAMMVREARYNGTDPNPSPATLQRTTPQRSPISPESVVPAPPYSADPNSPGHSTVSPQSAPVTPSVSGTRADQQKDNPPRRPYSFEMGSD